MDLTRVVLLSVFLVVSSTTISKNYAPKTMVHISDLENQVRKVFEILQKSKKGENVQSEFNESYELASQKISLAYDQIEKDFDWVTDEIQETWGGKNYHPTLESSLEKIVKNLRLSSEWSPKDASPGLIEEWNSLETEDSLITQALLPNFSSLVRIQASVGNYFPVVALLSLCASDFRILLNTLYLERARNEQEGRDRLYLEDFSMLLERMKEARTRFDSMFAEFPEFRSGSYVDLKNQTVNQDVFNEFLSGFKGKYKRRDGSLVDVYPSNELLQFIDISLQSIDYVEQYIKGYSWEKYPRFFRSEKLKDEAEKLSQLPGAHRCIGLVNGFLDDFDGEPCRPNDFMAGLKSFKKVYKENVGYSLLPLFIKLLTQKTSGGELDPSILLSVTEELDNTLAKESELPSWVRGGWNQTKENILSNPDGLKEVIGKGPDLYRYLHKAVESTDITPLLGLGFDRDYSEDFYVSEHLYEEASRMGLDRLPKELSEVDSSTSCKIFYDRDVKKSPLTVHSRKYAPLSPRNEKSGEGMGKSHWYHEVELVGVGDFKGRVDSDIQNNLEDLPLVLRQNNEPTGIVVASLLSQTAISMMVPNVVQTTLMLGEPAGNSLENYGGLEPETSRFISFSSDLNEPPSWEEIIFQNKKAFFSVLRGFAEEKGLLLPQNAYSAPEEFLMTTVLPIYQQVMAEKVGHAAEALREIDRMIELSKTQNGRVNMVPSPAEALSIPVEFIENGEAGKGGYNQAFVSVIPQFTPIYAAFKKGKVGSGSDEERRLNESIERGTLTGDQLYELFHLASDTYVDPVTGSETLIQGKLMAILGGPDNYNQFKNGLSPAQFDRLRTHVEQIASIDTEKLIHIKSLILSMYPMLLPNELWKTYGKGVDEFLKGVRKFRKNAISEAKKVIAFSETKPLLKHLVRQLPIIDNLLKRYPTQKLKICELHRDLFAWELENILDKASVALTIGAEGILLASAVCPFMTPVGVKASLVVGLVVTAMDSANAYLKWKRSEGASAIDAAVATEADFSSFERNQYELMRLRESFHQSMILATFQGASVGLASVLRLSATLRILKYQKLKMVRYFRNVTRGRYLRESLKSGLKLSERSILRHMPRKIQTFANGIGKVRSVLSHSFERLGIIQRPVNSFYSLLVGPGRFFKRGANLASHSLEFYINSPWSWVGFRWGGIAPIRYVGYAAIPVLIGETYYWLNKDDVIENEFLAQTVYEFPQNHKELIQWLESGEVTPEEFLSVAEHDHAFRGEFVSARERLIDEVMGNISQSETGEAQDKLAELKELLQTVDKLLLDSRDDGHYKYELMNLRWKRENLVERIGLFEKKISVLKGLNH